jgi:biopolymer transport protein ExbD
MSAVLLASCSPQVEKPATQQATIVPAPPVAIATAGDVVRWNGEQVSLDELERRTREVVGRRPDTEFHLEPGPPSNLHFVSTVMQTLQRAGARNVGVIGGT